MTKAMAHEILTFWKTGIKRYPPEVITFALYVTGDIDCF
jgi:hypothetical protein